MKRAWVKVDVVLKRILFLAQLDLGLWVQWDVLVKLI